LSKGKPLETQNLRFSKTIVNLIVYFYCLSIRIEIALKACNCMLVIQELISMGIRNKISTEEMAIAILKKSKEPMLISEIVELIKKKSSTHLIGKTPEKSFYSMIYRNDKTRVANNEKAIFNKILRGSTLFLELNLK
jgi:hypothetical protein